MSADYTSITTTTRIPPPSPHNFNPLYIAAAEGRAESVEEEEARVDELRELIQHYHREYARIADRICDSRSRFNAAAYISRLPAEILETIFEAYVVDHWASYYTLVGPGRRMDQYDITPYQWIRGVLHVCRQWRRVALLTPQLWTVIAHDRIYEPWRLGFLLEHAGSLPLSLRNDKILVKAPESMEDHWDDEYYRRNRDPRGLVLFQDALHKIAQFEVLSLIVTPEMEPFLTTLKGEDDNEDINALSMRYLRLDLSDDTLEATPLFINVNMPHLRLLSLLQGRLELVQRLSCSSLTHLDVSFSESVAMSELLDMLEDTSHLRQLLVDGIVSDEDDAIPQRTVPLLSLERLHIGGPILMARRLLYQLIFPVDAMIELQTDDEPTFALLSPLMPVILGCTTTDADLDHPAGPHTLYVWDRYGSRGHTISVWFWGMATPPPVPDTSQTRAALLDRAGGPRLNLVCPCSTRWLDVLDITDLLSLHVGYEPGVNDWDKVFRRSAFLTLETLSIDQSCYVAQMILQGLIKLVEETTQITVDSGDSSKSVQAPCTSLPLPNLKTLILGRLFLEIPLDARKIFSLLRRCAQLGYRLQLLRLTKIFLLGAAKKTAQTVAAVQDVLSKLGIADVVEVD